MVAENNEFQEIEQIEIDLVVNSNMQHNQPNLARNEEYKSNYKTPGQDFISMEKLITHGGEVIKVIGVGGGGCNAVSHMMGTDLKEYVEFLSANTDSKALSCSSGHKMIQLGHSLTRGLGAGSEPEIGKKAAMEDREKIAALLKGTDMLFICAGMGGGTGTGAAPVIADIAKSLGILTVGVVTKPFFYEGNKRKMIAERGIEEMLKCVDSLIVVPNEKLMTELDNDIEEISMRDAFLAVDNVLCDAISGITEVIKLPGIMSVDFADVKTVMTGKGFAMMGSALSEGQDRAKTAAHKAICCPLLEESSLEGAKGVLVNISSNGSLKLREYHEIIGIIQELIHPEADFKAGMAEVADMDSGQIRVTVIATGLRSNPQHHSSHHALHHTGNPFNDFSASNSSHDELVFDNNPFSQAPFLRKKI
jgi:cell division protein FtsZ